MIFFDMKSDWKVFLSVLNNPLFIKAVNLYHLAQYSINNNHDPDHNNSTTHIDTDGLSKPLIETSTNFLIPIDEDMIEDIHFINEQLQKDYSINNPYWFCFPGDCIQSNSILMTTLYRLCFRKECYIVSYVTNNQLDSIYHVVVSNKPVDPGKKLKFNDNSDNVIFYDLIYPLCSWYGKSFFNKSEDLKEVEILSCYSSEDYWKCRSFHLG